jgi:hypothetical protein
LVIWFLLHYLLLSNFSFIFVRLLCLDFKGITTTSEGSDTASVTTTADTAGSLTRRQRDSGGKRTR